MTLVVAGDVETDSLESRIIETFESMVNPKEPGSDPILGTVPVGTGFRTAVFADDELTKDTLEIFTVRETSQKRDTVANRIAKLHLDVSTSLHYKIQRTGLAD